MSRITYTKRERTQMRGYCTGPHDGAPAPGDVGLDCKAACCTCSARVSVTKRGLYSHHKAPAPQRMPNADEIRGLVFLADSFSCHAAEGLGTGNEDDDELARKAARWINGLRSRAAHRKG